MIDHTGAKVFSITMAYAAFRYCLGGSDDAHDPRRDPLARAFGRAGVTRKAATMTAIRYEPAECMQGCTVPDCPYTHEESWFVGVVSFQTKKEAEEFAAALDKDIMLATAKAG